MEYIKRKGGINIKKWAVIIMVLFMTIIVVGCLGKDRENEHTVLINLFDELYYIPETVDESTYTPNEMIGKITSTVPIEETPKENFGTNENTLNNVEVYSIEEEENVYVIPYKTERHGNRYHVLKKFDGD